MRHNHEAPHRPRFIASYVRWVVDHPLIVIMLTMVMLAATGNGISQLAFKKDYKYFFGRNNPQLMNYESLQNVYNKNDNILIAIEPAAGDIFNAEVLNAIEELTHAAWQIPYAIRVDSVTNFQYSRAMGDDLFVDDLIKDAAQLTPQAIAAARHIALKEPLLVNRLLHPDGRVAGMNITLEMPGKAMDEQGEAIRYTRQLCDRIKTRYPTLNTYVTGIVALDNAMSEASSDDIQTLIPLMFLGMTLAIALIFRSFYCTAVILAVIGMSSASALGISGWLEIPMTPPAAVAPIMIMTLAVADCVHIFEAMFPAFGGRTHDKKEAIKISLMLNMKPVFLTSLTTAIGFLSMNLSDAPPLVDLGNISAIGVVMAFIYAVGFLPAMVMILPIKNAYRRFVTPASFHRLANLIVRRKFAIIAVCLPLFCLLAGLVPMNELNDQWVKYFAKKIPFRTDTDFVQEHLTGIYQIEYSIDSGRTNGVTDPDYLAKIEQFEQWWQNQPDVRHVNSFCEVMRRLNKNMHGDQPDHYRIPQSQELAAQYLIIYEMSLPYGLDLNNQINIDKSSMRFIVTMNDIGTKQLRAMALEGERWLRRHAPETKCHTVTSYCIAEETRCNGSIIDVLGITSNI